MPPTGTSRLFAGGDHDTRGGQPGPSNPGTSLTPEQRKQQAAEENEARTQKVAELQAQQAKLAQQFTEAEANRAWFAKYHGFDKGKEPEQGRPLPPNHMRRLNDRDDRHSIP